MERALTRRLLRHNGRLGFPAWYQLALRATSTPNLWRPENGCEAYETAVNGNLTDCLFHWYPVWQSDTYVSLERASTLRIPGHAGHLGKQHWPTQS